MVENRQVMDIAFGFGNRLIRDSFHGSISGRPGFRAMPGALKPCHSSAMYTSPKVGVFIRLQDSLGAVHWRKRKTNLFSKDDCSDFHQ